MADKIKLLYIAGPTRSGSTILSNILGGIEGFFNAGELIDFWDRGIASNGLCSCGEVVRQCKLWKPILDEMVENHKSIDINEMIGLRDKLAHSRLVMRFKLRSDANLKLRSDIGKYVESLGALYHLIHQTTKAEIIIDSSKNAGYAYILSLIDSLNLSIVHLIRDPRAIAYSWQRKKNGLWQENYVKNALVWVSRNVATELVGLRVAERYLILDYEKFVSKPRQTVKKILNLVGDDQRVLPFVGDNQVKLKVNHSVYGNPDRFKTGNINLIIDSEWEQKMKKFHKAMVFALTWPLLLRYRYLIT
jgi:hypothetical protein